jgi:hypothetical protein
MGVPTQYVSSTVLFATVSAADLTGSTGSVTLTVANPGTTTAAANSATLMVENPAPVIASLSPNDVVTGSGAFTLTVNGTGFVTGATVFVNGSSRMTTLVSSTQLTAALLAMDATALAGSQAAITVQNPSPSLGASAAADLNFENPTAGIAMVSPASALGGTGASITVTGSNFVQGAFVQLGPLPLATTFINATTLAAYIPPSGPVGTLPLIVVNPAPSAGLSLPVTFNNAAAGAGVSLTIVSVDPNGNTNDVSGSLSSSARYFAFANFLRDTCLGAPDGCVPSTIDYADGYTAGLDTSRVAGPVTPDGAYVASSIQQEGTGDLEFSTTCVTGDPNCFANTQVLQYAPIYGISSITADGRYIGFSTGYNGDESFPGYIYDTCIGAAGDCSQQAISVTDSGLSTPDISSASPFAVYAQQGSNGTNVILHVSARTATQGWQLTDTVLSDTSQQCTQPIISSDAASIAYTCNVNGLNEVFYQSTCLNGDGRCNLIPHQVTSGDADSSQNNTVAGISSGGRYVSYVTDNASVSGQSLGYRMVFVYDTCAGASGSCTPKAAPICLNSDGAVADSDCSGGQMTDDGNFIAIYSEADNLVGGTYGASYVAVNPLWGN